MGRPTSSGLHYVPVLSDYTTRIYPLGLKVELPMNTYRRVLRGAESANPFWVVLPEESCVRQNFSILRDFCEQRGLSLSRHGRSMARSEGYYQVFMFADKAHADLFCKEFNGERMRVSERDKPRKFGRTQIVSLEQKTRKLVRLPELQSPGSLPFQGPPGWSPPRAGLAPGRQQWSIQPTNRSVSVPISYGKISEGPKAARTSSGIWPNRNW